MRVDHRVHVGPGTVEAGMEADGGRWLPVALEHVEIHAHLHDAIGQRLVEVLERRDVEGVLTLGTRADVPGDPALAAVARQDPAGGGDLESDVVDVHHALARAPRSTSAAMAGLGRATSSTSMS